MAFVIDTKIFNLLPYNQLKVRFRLLFGVAAKTLFELKDLKMQLKFNSNLSFHSDLSQNCWR